MNLFIANLNPASSGKDLMVLFSHYGSVNTTKIIFNRVTGLSKRYGFVEMPNISEALQAVAELNNTPFQNKIINVKVCIVSQNNRNAI